MSLVASNLIYYISNRMQRGSDFVFNYFFINFASRNRISAPCDGNSGFIVFIRSGNLSNTL